MADRYKAIVGGVIAACIAGLSYLAGVVDDGLKASEVIYAIVAFLGALIATGTGIFYTKNAPSSTPDVTQNPDEPILS